MNSKQYYRIGSFVLIGLLVMCIGGLAGWYVVLRQKGQTISFSDAVRGFGIGAPSAGQNGSTYDNIAGGFNVGAGGGSFSGGGGQDGASSGTGGAGGQDGTDFSIGASGTSSANGASTTTSPLANVIVFKTPRLWRVSKTPAAGFQFATSSYALYFVERATGYVFYADAVSADVLRRTNTLRPKTYEAFLTRNGNPLSRSINDSNGALETFNGSIGSASTTNVGALAGVNLRNNLRSFDANPDANKIFYVAPDETGFSGFTMPWTPGKTGPEKRVFTSNIENWKLFALSDGRLIVAEKPTDGALGYAYEVSSDGKLSPLLRGAPGLTMLPLSGSKALLFGTSAGGVLSLYAQTSTTTLSLPIKTVADKCVWSPYRPAKGKTPATDLVVYCAVPQESADPSFLQNWYMGGLHTADSWWRINLTNGRSEEIFSVSAGGTRIDVIDPTIDPSGSLIAFKNNMDGSLWVLRVVK